MKKVVVLLTLAFCLAAVGQACAFDDDVSAKWKTMSAKEKDIYATGISNALTVMCGIQSKNRDEYATCRNKYSMRPDMPKSLIELFDNAYTKGQYPNIPSDMLLHVWVKNDKTSMPSDLKKMEEFSKTRRPQYGGKHQ